MTPAASIAAVQSTPTVTPVAQPPVQCPEQPTAVTEQTSNDTPRSRDAGSAIDIAEAADAARTLGGATVPDRLPGGTGLPVQVHPSVSNAELPDCSR